MAYEALESLQQTLLLILQRHDDNASIHGKAAVLQFNLKRFPDKETIREVANTTKEIIQYLFSPQNLSSIDPTVRLSYQLGQLAEGLKSTVGDVVDYCKSNSNSVSDSPSSSRSVLKSEVEDLPVELIALNTSGLRRLADKIKSSGRELADEDPSDSPSITTKDDVAVVGFDEDIQLMMERITPYTSYHGLQILPIVGMGGIGKSTLPRHIYDHSSIKHHFDIRAWVTIPSILSQLLPSLNIKVDQDGKDSLKGIEAEKLETHKILLRRRYLIIMDDMWSAKAWDDVRKLFPENHCRSRIVLTTRLMNVATYAKSRWSPIHMMRFLDDEQSWRLFHHKVFGDQDCHQELRSVGEKIVKGCGGLPLSIVNVAGLLSRIPRTPKLWQKIEVNDGQLGSILSMSYNHLLPHLRKCFLYMAAFPEDYEIHASELIKLWIAEGFWELFEFERKELVAERCLNDLIGQSLVLVTSQNIDGKIKSCRLHIMVRDFCVRQAGREKFILPVMDYFPTPILRRHFLPQVLQNHPRISVSWHDLHLRDSTHSSCTTSIICIPQRGYKPKCYVENFTSLRVLHVLRRNDHSYWELGQVFELINLTYLASNIPDSIVPPAIAKLQNLQTLIIYRSYVRLPVEIWSLRKLRHLIAFSFQPLPLPQRATPSLVRLQTLSMAIDFVCNEKMVKMIPNIIKLGICYSGTMFGAGYYHTDNLIHLRQVEKLKLEMHGSYVPCLTYLPLSLKKLELCGRWISWRDMTIVGSLPYLRVLKRKNYACHGEHWETVDGEFGNLVLLLIDESNLQLWTAKSSHFPRLKCLMLHSCPYLDEIPHDIGNIHTHKLIEIDDHNQSLLYSANKIQHIHRKDHKNDPLKVVVKCS